MNKLRPMFDRCVPPTVGIRLWAEETLVDRWCKTNTATTIVTKTTRRGP